MSRERLQVVRDWASEQDLAGYVQPHEDEHLGEFVPAAAERLSWLTGFTGSAGTAVILDAEAALFVDGRYTIQARTQADLGVYDILDIGRCTPERWLADRIGQGAAIGYDPRLFSVSREEKIRKAIQEAGGEFTPVFENPVDSHWEGRPPAPSGDILAHPVTYAGESSVDKRERLTSDMEQGSVNAMVLSAPDSVAWLFNIRGTDLPYSPVALATALLNRDGTACLFVDPDNVDKNVRGHLGGAIRVLPPAALPEVLGALGTKHATVQIDPMSTPVWIETLLRESGAKVRRSIDPIALPKAIKNGTELEGMRHAHVVDGRAVAKFLCWLDAAVGTGTVTECGAADRLEEFRREDPLFRGPSFPTISGTGPHGAIVHYRASPETDRQLRPGNLYLVDSGGQYLAGTTDITRTVAIGEPTLEMRDRFTRVLKGHIALATVRFPRGTPGGQLDILARTPLWQVGLTYDHGTGHGVGSFLNVHEGPHSISFRVFGKDHPAVSKSALVPLVPGMVISNEPGYYRENAYGIRIENLVAVKEEPSLEGSEIELLGFETLTLAPIDRRLIIPEMLTLDELDWLDGYHARVLAAHAPKLDAVPRDWLSAACAPLGPDRELGTSRSTH